MGKFLKEWEAAKKTFSTDANTWLKAGGDGIPADLRKEVAFILKADTGLTPALKIVDDGFAKKHRKAVMNALTNVHAVVEKVAPVLVKVGGHFMAKSSEGKDRKLQNVLNELAIVVGTLNQALKKLEAGIAKDLESLQEAKSPDGKKIDIISLEGDMVAAIAKFKTATKPFAALEKQFQVLTKTAPATKAMTAYSKAAARTEVKAALTSLEDFFKAVDKFDVDCGKIGSVKPAPDKKYVDAVDTLRGALRTIKSQRATVSLKNLKKLEAEMT